MSKIVVLEDDHTLLILYRDVLERAEYAVFAAESIQSLQKYFDENSADLIIADLRIGITSAEETVQTLQQIQAQHAIPIIIVSAQMMIYEGMCRAAGFDHLLMKPFPNTVLIQMAEKVIAEAS